MSKHAYHAAVYLADNQLRKSGHITFTANSPSYWKNLRTSHSCTHLLLKQQPPTSHTALKPKALHHSLGPEDLLQKNSKQEKVSSSIWSTSAFAERRKALTPPRYTWSVRLLVNGVHAAINELSMPKPPQIVIPYHTFKTALTYFSGSTYFQRSI